MKGDKEARLIKHMASIKHMIDRAQYDSITMARKIARLVGWDLEDLCPDHAEEILKLMDWCDGVLKYKRERLESLLRLARENGEDMPNVPEVIYQTEGLRKSLQNLRLDIIRWVRQFEGIPTETERLELMMSLPSPEEDEAEKREAYRTGGASLLPKQGSPDDTRDVLT